MKAAHLARQMLWRQRPALPTYLIFFVTSRCNAKCHHCFYPTNQKHDDLTLEEVRRTAQTMGPLYHVNLTGGEPFLRRDLPDILRIFHAQTQTRSFGIPTNGWSPTRIRDSLREMIESCPDIHIQVTVSIDHLGKKHDEIRQVPGLFEKAAETVHTLKSQGWSQVITGVNLTLTAENQDEIEAIYDAIQHEIDPDFVNPLVVRGEPMEPATKEIDPAAYRRLTARWERDVRPKGGNRYPDLRLGSLITARDILSRRMIADKLEGRGRFLPCAGGTVGAVLYETGEVFPCEILKEGYGNLREVDYDFPKVWFGERAQKIRKQILDEHCTCTHECFQNLSVLFNAEALPSLMREWLAGGTR